MLYNIFEDHREGSHNLDLGHWYSALLRQTGPSLDFLDLNLVLAQVFNSNEVSKTIDLVLEYKQVWLEVCWQNIGIRRSELDFVFADALPSAVKNTRLWV